ncbi:alpha-hydroxy-acid oxidizing protein [Nguyenibacter vanlangensis]|uniref:Alpha-hydroxy-acid oxidizing protein n=1 Tax=Nguyenibacter vanlangensis TaxID=1216886 RepID=A0A7Y7ITS3_9PROT|nr:alpha-hydroxy-acid oxidizing protein [Nguyenibacter vanlangensis]
MSPDRAAPDAHHRAGIYRERHGRRHGLRRNRDALDALTLRPRYMRDVAARPIATELFGRSY